MAGCIEFSKPLFTFFYIKKWIVFIRLIGKKSTKDNELSQ